MMHLAEVECLMLVMEERAEEIEAEAMVVLIGGVLMVEQVVLGAEKEMVVEEMEAIEGYLGEAKEEEKKNHYLAGKP
jgi:hypothetical protein